ncbi:hypothetical protein O181_090279 [Austropuccinia psidii MF-1]|uniref:Uncharacterized protein n=1 Tax=Austropuccinia psidii MF-1 TaxID=1389203 RepID=A0A9Q3P6S3_9BASI|nr:hypothetical protein [Austropuccinia psidii MF-1]
MNLNQMITDNTRQKELWKEMKIRGDMYKIKLINSIQGLENEVRNSTRCNTNKMNEIQQLLHTFPKMSKPINESEGIGNYNPQVLDVGSSQIKDEFSASFHNLEPSMGQEILKEVPRLKEWPHSSGKG